MIYINADDNPITFNKKNYLLSAAGRLGLSYIKDYKDKGDEEAQYLLNIEPCSIFTGSRWSGLWHIDVLLNNEKYVGSYPHMDKIYISSDQSKYPMEKTDVLFQACDPLLHRRHEDIKQEYDFVMCGSNGGVWKKRGLAIELLRGMNFTFHDYAKDHKPEKYIENINHAKVQFIRTGEGDEGRGAVAQRFFECLAIGPVLTNYTADIPLLGLIEGIDFMTYKNDKEMVEKMDMLINDKKLRDTIATNGRRKALLYHSYESRLVAILNDINFPT